MIAALRQFMRPIPSDAPPLLEPTTREALDRALVNHFDLLAGPVLAVLSAVRDGQASSRFERAGIRDTLGGLGLIVRFGARDTITPAGLALLSNAGARP